MTKFATLRIYEFFPSFDQAIHITDSPTDLYDSYGILQICIAGFFIIITIFDLKFFVFHPFELAIVVDLNEKTEQDRAVLRKLAIESELENDKKSVHGSFGQRYRDFNNQNNRISLNINSVAYRKQNSFLRVFRIQEYNRVLISSMLYELALIILIIDAKSQLTAQIKESSGFLVYGSMSGLLTLGVYTDFLARRNLYTLLVSLIFVQILLVTVQTVYQFITSSQDFIISNNFATFLVGYFYGLSSITILQQLPLYIAGRYRDMNSVWELPLAGQMLAVVQIFALWIPLMLAPVVLGLFYAIVPSQNNSETPGPKTGSKFIVLIILIFSVLPLRYLVKFEAAQRRLQKLRSKRYTSDLSGIANNRLTSGFGDQNLITNQLEYSSYEDDMDIVQELNKNVIKKSVTINR